MTTARLVPVTTEMDGDELDARDARVAEVEAQLAAQGDPSSKTAGVDA